MTYKELKLQIKEELKVLAQAIKQGKTARKPKNRNEENYGFYNALYWNKINYRHKHIAYCEFFNNTPYEQIEQPRSNNKPNRSKIDSYKNEWTELLDWDGQIIETIRHCA